jgi:hypothetical protein
MWRLTILLAACGAAAAPAPAPMICHVAAPAAAIVTAAAEGPASGAAMPRPPESGVLVDGDVVFHMGDRVRVTGRAGAAKPAASGHATDLAIDAPLTGTLVGIRQRDDGAALLAIVRWDPQTWHEWGTGTAVQIDSFADIVHPTYLEIIR